MLTGGIAKHSYREQELPETALRLTSDFGAKALLHSDREVLGSWRTEQVYATLRFAVYSECCELSKVLTAGSDSKAPCLGSHRQQPDVSNRRRHCARCEIGVQIWNLNACPAGCQQRALRKILFFGET